MTVSVKGGSYTTIEIVAGTYTVTEIPSWSWRYEDGVVAKNEGVIDATNTYEELWTTVTTETDDGEKVTLRQPKTLGYGAQDDDGKTLSHWTVLTSSAHIVLDTMTKEAVVTYTHESKNKKWLGGESAQDYPFLDEQQP